MGLELSSYPLDSKRFITVFLFSNIPFHFVIPSPNLPLSLLETSILSDLRQCLSSGRPNETGFIHREQVEH